MADQLTRMIDNNAIEQINRNDYIVNLQGQSKYRAVREKIIDAVPLSLNEFFRFIDADLEFSPTNFSMTDSRIESKEKYGSIVNSIRVYFLHFNELYAKVLTRILDNPQIHDFKYELISINSQKLRKLLSEGKTKQQIAGIFITEMHSNYLHLIQEMDASQILDFMRGVKDYANTVSAEADEAIEVADKRTSEALAAEETAVTSEGLSDAISYWTSKQATHEKQTRRTFWTFCAVLVAGLVLLFWGPTISGWLIGLPSGADAQVPAAVPSSTGSAPASTAKTLIEHLRGFILPTLAIAWLLRLISRQYITHLALQEDARLRGVLVRTFLALQRNTDADIDEKERAHMLEAIFRPLPTTPTNDVNQPSFADIAKGVK